ncbi:hemA [Symbiodinium sp. CCMP2592]|nr:hemA [Symbiodinium sp. CCMP2592]
MWNPGPRHGSLVEGKDKRDRQDRVCPFHFGNAFHIRYVATVLGRIEEPIKKAEFRIKFLDKLRFLDQKTKAGNTLEEKLDLLSLKDWEAISALLDENRALAAGAGLYLRPRLEEPSEPEETAVVLQEPFVPQQDGRPAEGEYTRTEISYLRTARGHRGVFQIHKVKSEDATEGYLHLFRISQVWPLLKRQQAFHNWQDNLTAEMSQEWKISVSAHLIRSKDYKGKQQGALEVLDTIISSTAPADLELRLLPNIPACKIRCHDLDVDLHSLETFLGFMGWLPRWQKFAMISPAQRKLQAGIRLHSLVFFIMRTPLVDEACEDEKLAHMDGVLLSKIPLPTPDDQFHPATMDGRALKKEPKPRNLLALELDSQRFRSLNMISDASPKARMDVWLPLLTVDKTMVPWVLQRLSDLLPSTVSTETKMEEAQKLADQAARTDAKQGAASKVPKTISKIRQQRLSTREHLRAVLHCMELLECELEPPKQTLMGARPKEHLIVEKYDGCSFRCNTQSGESEWLRVDKELLRLVLQGDQGGPLYSAYQYAAAKGFPVCFIRDESHPGLILGLATIALDHCRPSGVAHTCT